MKNKDHIRDLGKIEQKQRKKTRVLHVENSPIKAKLIWKFLSQENGEINESQFEVKQSEKLSQAIEILSRGEIDVVLLDLFLPDSEGVNTFSRVQDVSPNVPIVVLSERNNEKMAEDVLRKGAQDYLPKDHLTSAFLRRALHYAIDRRASELLLNEVKREVESKAWGLEKTNESVKLLYKELENKNKKLKGLDQLKSEFVSTVSHELRTPMTIIREGVSQVLDGLLGQVTAEQKEFLGITLAGIDRLSRIINDLLDFSKLEAGKVELDRESLDLVALCRQVIKVFEVPARAKGLVLKCSSQMDEVRLLADRDKLIQVLTNLVGNAMKFTVEGSIEIHIEDDGQMIACDVVDTGPGIAKGDLGRVFGQFEQVGRVAGPGDKGTGLGLAISKAITELHGGKIGVESKVGVGTKFRFTLPKVSAEELLREYVAGGIERAIREESTLSIIVMPIRNFAGVKEKIGDKEAALLLQHLTTLLKNSLRRKGDRAVASQEHLLIFLHGTGKDDALMVAGRMRQIVDEHVRKLGLDRLVSVASKVAAFPGDGNSAEELLKKAFS